MVDPNGFPYALVLTNIPIDVWRRKPLVCVCVCVCVSMSVHLLQYVSVHTHIPLFTHAQFSIIRGHNAVPSSSLQWKTPSQKDRTWFSVKSYETRWKEKLQKASYQNFKITKFLLWASFNIVVCASKLVVKFALFQTFIMILLR